MLGKLNIVMIQPAAWNAGESIKTSNAFLSKKRGQDVTDNATYGMGCENLIL